MGDVRVAAGDHQRQPAFPAGQPADSQERLAGQADDPHVAQPDRHHLDLQSPGQVTGHARGMLLERPDIRGADRLDEFAAIGGGERPREVEAHAKERIGVAGGRPPHEVVDLGQVGHDLGPRGQRSQGNAHGGDRQLSAAANRRHEVEDHGRQPFTEHPAELLDPGDAVGGEHALGVDVAGAALEEAHRHGFSGGRAGVPPCQGLTDQAAGRLRPVAVHHRSLRVVARHGMPGELHDRRDGPAGLVLEDHEGRLGIDIAAKVGADQQPVLLPHEIR